MASWELKIILDGVIIDRLLAFTCIPNVITCHVSLKLRHTLQN